jgi:hypothetical protein
MLAAEHAFQFHLVDAAAQVVEAADHLAEGFLVLLLHGHVEEHVRLLEVGEVLFPDADQVLQLAELALDPLGLVLVVPEVGADGLPLEQLYLFPFAI